MRISRNFRNRQPDGVQTLGQKVASILRKYGTDAHVYLPGIGVINGLTAGNYLDSAGTTAATVDNPVGLVKDANGTINATQATTANKPILRKGAVNLLTYSSVFTNAAWSKRGTLAVNPTPIAGPLGVTNGYTLTGLDTGNNDLYYLSTGVTLGGSISPSIYVKRISTSGVFSLQNANTTLRGNWTVNLALLSDSWERITSIHPAVTIINAFTGGLNDGLMLKGVSGGALSLSISSAQLETGSTTTTYAPTTTAPASNLVGGYHWVHDSTDVLTATFPAGYESATTINASTAGQSTLTAQNIVGAYNIGPSIDTYGRFIFRTGLTASELTTVQQYANRLAGL